MPGGQSPVKVNTTRSGRGRRDQRRQAAPVIDSGAWYDKNNIDDAGIKANLYE